MPVGKSLIFLLLSHRHVPPPQFAAHPTPQPLLPPVRSPALRMRLLRPLWGLAMTISLSTGFPLPAAFAAEEPMVRVAILQEVPSARITVPVACRLKDLEKGTVLAEWPELKWKEVKADAAGLSVGGAAIASGVVMLEPSKDAIFRVNAKPYRGGLILSRTSSGKLRVINRLSLEEYLVSAVASETSSEWPMEVLKAHAVVSRTLVAHRIWIRKGQPFDVDGSTHLYHGVSAESRRTREAVEATRGQVLASRGELFSATFCTSCGGHTEDAAELWETKGDLTPLKGVPDPYCKDLRHYRWETAVSVEEFKHLLGPTVDETGAPVNVEAGERNPSGRVRSVRIQGEKGSAWLTGRRFRELLGENRLRSLNFTAVISGRRALFSGFGWGHGVGFCQWGAYGMARKGFKMDEILQHYFPGTQRRGLKGLPGFN